MEWTAFSTRVCSDWNIYRAEGALTFSAKEYRSVSQGCPHVSVCVSVSASVAGCESFLERSDLLSQRDRKPFNTALDRYNVPRFSRSNRPQLPAQVRNREFAWGKSKYLTEICPRVQVNLKMPLPSARPCPAGLFLVTL